MDEQKKTRDLNDVTRELVAARAAGDRDDIDYLAAIKGLFERHPQLLTDADLFKKASDRDEELRKDGTTFYTDRMERIADELDGARDPVADALAASIENMNTDQAEALVHLIRTGTVPTAPDREGEEHADTQAIVGIMGATRASVQVNRALAHVTGRAMGLEE